MINHRYHKNKNNNHKNNHNLDYNFLLFFFPSQSNICTSGLRWSHQRNRYATHYAVKNIFFFFLRKIDTHARVHTRTHPDLHMHAICLRANTHTLLGHGMFREIYLHSNYLFFHIAIDKCFLSFFFVMCVFHLFSFIFLNVLELNMLICVGIFFPLISVINCAWLFSNFAVYAFWCIDAAVMNDLTKQERVLRTRDSVLQAHTKNFSKAIDTVKQRTSLAEIK